VLFGPDFRRHADDGINARLNWGYAVVRGIVARAICAAGLHPCLGLHHHNASNTFCLADDLIEVFRPIVDGAVFSLLASGAMLAINKDTKQRLLSALLQPIETRGEQRQIFDVAARLAFSLAAVAAGTTKKLCLP
jgi:CRISPR-associated protein Cas1